MIQDLAIHESSAKNNLQKTTRICFASYYILIVQKKMKLQFKNSTLARTP